MLDSFIQPFDFTNYIFGNKGYEGDLDVMECAMEVANFENDDVNKNGTITDDFDSMEDNNNVQNIETYIDDSDAGNTHMHQQLLPEEHIEKTKKRKKTRRKYKHRSFSLRDFSQLSPYNLWLLSFDVAHLDKKVEKSEEKRKKKMFKKSIQKSVEKAPDIVTEPLADLLAKQGHFDEAKKMYTHLMHKYPEKFIYFAAKIENLNK